MIGKEWRGIAAAGLAATVAASWPTMASAQAFALRDALFGAPADDRAFHPPPVARFQTDGGSVFVLDRSSGQVLMRFEDGAEIWALKPHTAPRGDVIYKNDVGDPVLRSTRVGGLTVFTPGAPGGAAAAFAGPAPGLRLAPVQGASALLHIFALSSARASRAAQRLISFEAEDVPMAATPLFADAARITSEAFVLVAARGENGRQLVGRYAKVEFDAGDEPDAAAKGRVVRITVAPTRGVAGRPSSQRIASVIGRR